MREIDYGATRQQHKLRYQDQLFHVASLDPQATVTYKSTESYITTEWQGSLQRQVTKTREIDKSFTKDEVTRLKRVATDARRRNYIETGAEKHEVDEILEYGRIMDEPVILTPGKGLIIHAKL